MRRAAGRIGRSLAALGMAGALSGLATGCGGGASRGGEAEAWSVGADPCADRLHELSGLLLLYAATRGRLPEKLEDLQALSAGPVELTCPASGKPYLYDREGIAVPGRPGLVVVRDPLPSHSGLRWAISVLPAEGAAPLTTRVIALVESPGG